MRSLLLPRDMTCSGTPGTCKRRGRLMPRPWASFEPPADCPGKVTKAVERRSTGCSEWKPWFPRLMSSQLLIAIEERDPTPGQPLRVDADQLDVEHQHALRLAGRAVVGHAARDPES